MESAGHALLHQSNLFCIQLLTWSFLRGLTMAQYRSADRAVRVKTDTPMEMSLAVSDSLHTIVPHGQDSRV